MPLDRSFQASFCPTSSLCQVGRCCEPLVPTSRDGNCCGRASSVGRSWNPELAARPEASGTISEQQHEQKLNKTRAHPLWCTAHPNLASHMSKRTKNLCTLHGETHTESRNLHEKTLQIPWPSRAVFTAKSMLPPLLPLLPLLLLPRCQEALQLLHAVHETRLVLPVCCARRLLLLLLGLRAQRQTLPDHLTQPFRRDMPAQQQFEASTPQRQSGRRHLSACKVSKCM